MGISKGSPDLAVLCRSDEGAAAKNVVSERTNDTARVRSSFSCRHPSTQALYWFKEPERFYFTRPPRPVIAKGSVMRPAFSDPHQLAPGGSGPPVATSPRNRKPLIPDREALRAFAWYLRGHST